MSMVLVHSWWLRPDRGIALRVKKVSAAANKESKLRRLNASTTFGLCHAPLNHDSMASQHHKKMSIILLSCASILRQYF